ncbi:MAG: methionine synthase [bacterium]|nr:methionine synthase [bacterium]
MNLLERLANGEVVVGDGGLGTMLMERLGGEPGACPETVNLSQPEILTGIARLYVEAGAEIITTNTFGASPAKLAQYGHAGDAEAINRAGVAAARQAAEDSAALVAASIGPTGLMLQPYGDTPPDELLEGFLAQARSLTEAGADMILVETMLDLHEARLAVRAARQAAPHLPLAATMTFQQTPRGFFTIMGVDIKAAAMGLTEEGADIVGSNCGNGSELMREVAREFRMHTQLPLLIQANAGMPAVSEGDVSYSETPEQWVADASAIAALHPCIIGGCCGTGPEHIRQLRDKIRDRR